MEFVTGVKEKTAMELPVFMEQEEGTTVTVDLGDGYQAIYGQLKCICDSQKKRWAPSDSMGRGKNQS